jgi:hypothetical protein
MTCARSRRRVNRVDEAPLGGDESDVNPATQRRRNSWRDAALANDGDGERVGCDKGHASESWASREHAGHAQAETVLHRRRSTPVTHRGHSWPRRAPLAGLRHGEFKGN